MAEPNTDLLNAAEIEKRLSTEKLGRALLFLEETNSTSEVARKLAEDGAPHGQAVVAESQTAGKGRRGRTWISPRSVNIYLSLVLRSTLPPFRVPELTLVAATALCEVLQEVGCAQARIKWPNDIEIGGKKVAGILTELFAKPGESPFVILGIGIDANMGAADFPLELRDSATSLREATGIRFSRAELIAKLLACLEWWLDQHLHEGFAVVRERWIQLSSTVGASVRVEMEGRRIEGVVEGIDNSGALLVRLLSGVVERVLVGDVETLRAGQFASP